MTRPEIQKKLAQVRSEKVHGGSAQERTAR